MEEKAEAREAQARSKARAAIIKIERAILKGFADRRAAMAKFFKSLPMHEQLTMWQKYCHIQVVTANGRATYKGAPCNAGKPHPDYCGEITEDPNEFDHFLCVQEDRKKAKE